MTWRGRFGGLAVVAFPVIILAQSAPLQNATPPPGRTPGAGPVAVVETSRGTFEFETYPDDAPRTVAHVLALIERRFYDGLRVHRVEAGFVIQLGDPLTRDEGRRASWGTGGSGTPVGLAEFSRRRRHTLGAVAMAHPGNPAQADAQFYVTLAPVPRLDGKYTVFGQVIAGLDVLPQIRVGDVVERVWVRR